MIKQSFICIPKQIWHDNSASWLAKILFSEIMRNCTEKSSYKIDWKYMEQFMAIDELAIKDILLELQTLLWIRIVEQIDGTTSVKTLFKLGFTEYRPQKNKNENTSLILANQKEKEDAVAAFKECIIVYEKWHETSFEFPPKFVPGDFVALKSILNYLQAQIKSDKYTVIDLFKQLLSGWPKLDTFTQSKTRLIDINNNFNNIVNQLKNAKSTKSTGNTSGPRRDNFDHQAVSDMLRSTLKNQGG